MSAYPRGSEWRRWDLQVHSPLSILNNDFPRLANGEPDWNSYIAALEQQPIAVYGITDYFTIAGYKTLREKQANDARLNGVRLLPNVEFRLDKLINPRGGHGPARRLNFHVLFSDQVAPQDIEDHFLYDLNFAYEQNPEDRGQQKRLKSTNLEELGRQLKAEDASFTQPPLQVGAMTAIVRLEDIIEVLRSNDRFKDRYLLLLPAENWDQIAWGGQDHLTRKLLLQAAHMVLSSNPHTIAWCLGQTPYADGPAHFMKEFRTLKPSVHGSDAHSLPFVGYPCARRGDQTHDCAVDRAACELRNCWIKADPTFEGLRQLLYEPYDRVRIQAADPTPTKSIFSLTKIAIPRVELNPELTIDTVDLPLNAGLIAVTGSKGSGKTALVDVIAHAFMNRETTSNRNSFVRRIADAPQKLSFGVEFAEGTHFDKTLGDGKFFDMSTVVYIAQGELETYIDEQSDLNEYIHRLIFNSAAIKDTVDAFDFESLNARSKALQADLDAKNSAIVQLEQATTPSAEEAVAKAGKQAKAELDDIAKRLAALEAKLSKDKIEANTKKQEQVAKKKAERDQLAKARDLARDTLRAIDTQFAAVAATVVSLNVLIKALALGTEIAAPTYPDRARIVEIQAAIDTALRATVLAIENEDQEIKQLAEELREHSKLLSRRQELTTRHADLQQQWKELQAKKQVLTHERAARNELLKQLLQVAVAKREQYSKLIATCAAAKEPILADLDFQAHVAFDPASFLSYMESLVDNRQVEVDGTENVPSAFKPLLDLFGELAAGEERIGAAVNETTRLSDELRVKLKKSIIPEHLYRALYRSYLSVHPVVLYKQTGLDRLSLGQKATVLMKIYLAEGDNPIIIDSHDDHLDNEYIMEELVGAIRHAKLYRQVIIASNNGNVVVNSDAEQVIVAKRRDGVISYVSGALEDPDIRDLAVKVLEGGPDAFRKRQEKYRMA